MRIYKIARPEGYIFSPKDPSYIVQERLGRPGLRVWKDGTVRQMVLPPRSSELGDEVPEGGTEHSFVLSLVRDSEDRVVDAIQSKEGAAVCRAIDNFLLKYGFNELNSVVKNHTIWQLSEAEVEERVFGQTAGAQAGPRCQ